MLGHCCVVCSSVIECGLEEPASAWVPASHKGPAAVHASLRAEIQGCVLAWPSGRGRGRGTVAPAMSPDDPGWRGHSHFAAAKHPARVYIPFPRLRLSSPQELIPLCVRLSPPASAEAGLLVSGGVPGGLCIPPPRPTSRVRLLCACRSHGSCKDGCCVEPLTCQP